MKPTTKNNIVEKTSEYNSNPFLNNTNDPINYNTRNLFLDNTIKKQILSNIKNTNKNNLGYTSRNHYLNNSNGTKRQYKNKTNFKLKIINLSTYKLNKNQSFSKLLKLGLKFFPTPKSNIREPKKDLKEFERKLRLIEKFKYRKIYR